MSWRFTRACEFILVDPHVPERNCKALASVLTVLHNECIPPRRSRSCAMAINFDPTVSDAYCCQFLTWVRYLGTNPQAPCESIYFVAVTEVSPPRAPVSHLVRLSAPPRWPCALPLRRPWLPPPPPRPAPRTHSCCAPCVATRWSGHRCG
jgi:hypothetical protein